MAYGFLTSTNRLGITTFFVVIGDRGVQDHHVFLVIGDRAVQDHHVFLGIGFLTSTNRLVLIA